MSILQELKDGEVGSDGVRRPPTSLMLRTGREMQELLNVLQGLETNLAQDRANVEALFNQIDLLKEENARLINENTALRDAQRKIGEVGDGSGAAGLSGTNQISEANPEPEDSSAVSGTEGATDG